VAPPTPPAPSPRSCHITFPSSSTIKICIIICYNTRDDAILSCPATVKLITFSYITIFPLQEVGPAAWSSPSAAAAAVASPIALEMCRDHKAAVLSLLVQLPTGGTPYLPRHHPGTWATQLSIILPIESKDLIFMENIVIQAYNMLSN
jgi:hypothetical protein